MSNKNTFIVIVNCFLTRPSSMFVETITKRLHCICAKKCNSQHVRIYSSGANQWIVNLKNDSGNWKRELLSENPMWKCGL